MLTALRSETREHIPGAGANGQLEPVGAPRLTNHRRRPSTAGLNGPGFRATRIDDGRANWRTIEAC
eukprot:2345358-Pyramimonas_sp.AAC.1